LNAVDIHAALTSESWALTVPKLAIDDSSMLRARASVATKETFFFILFLLIKHQLASM